MYSKPNRVIIGGTGTLGKELLSRFPNATVFSRDEAKQQELRRLYPLAKFVVGDVRNADRVWQVVQNADEVYHVAALKHIDVCEANIAECIETNVNGTKNVVEACVTAGVDRLVFSSTDKAVLPINVYGHTKAIGEKLVLAHDYEVYRWGNVFGSRGSVIHHFLNTLPKGYIEITHPDMTRFWIHIADAVNFMVEGGDKGPGQVNIPPMKAAKVSDVASALAKRIGVKQYKTKYVGMRPGEKIHECIYSSHESCLRSDTAEQLTSDEISEMIARVVAL